MAIHIVRISDLDRNKYDRNIAIVRSMRSKSDWIEQMPELSPSKELFFEYRRLAEQGAWDEDAFQQTYVPRFLSEMTGPDARSQLNQLYAESRFNGKEIALACFCTDETLCHRSIIAGLFQGAGADVRIASKADYSRYYDMLYEQKG